MNKHYTAVLDLGGSKLVMVLATSNSNHINEIIAISEQPSNGIKRGLVLNIAETVKVIKASVIDIFKQTGIQIKTVNVNCNGQHIKMIKKRLAFDLKPKEFEIAQLDYISLIKRTYPTLIENRDEIIQAISTSKPIVSESKTIIDFNIITGHSTSIENLKKVIELSGLEINQLVPDPLAASHSVLSSKEKEEGVVLVDIGGGTTDLAVFSNEVLQHTAVIPIGGNTVTSDIKQAFSVLQAQAEELKIQYGSALQSKTQKGVVIQVPGLKGREEKTISLNDLVFVIQERMKDIIYAIKFQIEQSGYADRLNVGIVITGGAAKLKHLDLLIKDMTGYEVRIGIPRCNDNIKEFDRLNAPSYATAIGLLQYQ
ncbi:MAG: cell division protein FtsA [Bacteroidales bacterium]|jgi:cell division protein FtsA|nr:cell division protein FtsA [Bacteroidales bacterium]